MIGGGFAGAAASSRLTEQGVTVTLLEQRATLGGRTTSLRDGATREEVDNGQHLFLGCYQETRRFLRRLGIENRLRFLPFLKVSFRSPGGRQSVLECPPLPGGLGFLAGLWRFRELSLRDRWRLFGALTRMRVGGPGKNVADLTVSQWLDGMKQTEGARRAFWTPLCLATLNARPAEACAEAFWVVLREGFLGPARHAALGYATVSLGKLWSVELAAYLKRQGGVVASRQAASGFEVSVPHVEEVLTENGERVKADAVVCAVPLSSFLKICPKPILDEYKHLSSVPSSSILSINLWFRKPLIDDLFAGLLDTDVQWIFNRYRLWENRGASVGYVSLVLSAASPWARFSSEELIRRALSDLKRCFPGLDTTNVHGTVIWEKQATPCPTPFFWKNRPSIHTPFENFFVAGDWVNSGLPPTIEAAVRSGHRAAELVQSYLAGRLEAAPVSA